ncbi:class I SAM-dependent methyltransferase [Actinomadura sp. 7K534]|uniref:class I SAM-dependent methyltransferase n=1 Tax=Actinomadura sp. 7K534 TaxID=2530366 RepID=UPI00104ACEC9|nr:class I SAM-dependent methyltransferase [Actinomadura sp. 7K534]TDB98855.1 class I SAM-dependent methyltransferase [Actinomadura sp. 7K534]
MQYGQAHAEVYDLVFTARGKDFRAESERLAQLIRARMPGASSLLDVACGTGAHLEVLAEHFEHVEGVELAPGMREVACRRLPGRVIHGADMRTFDLRLAFDAVICVGNSVACLDSAEELNRAVERMAAHLVRGGVLVVEPWFFSGDFLDGWVDGSVHKEDGRVVTQLTRAAKDGDKVRMEARFVVADRDGFHEFDETLTARPFARDEYTAALENAGLKPEFVRGFTLADGRPLAPGLFIGTRR